MLYFAYGSNMDWFQMRERCPSARFVGVALLPDHELAFTRKSIKRNCGVADAIATKGQKLWGVLYEITEPDVARLDKSEGYAPGREKNSYFRRECVVWLDGNDRRPATASIYFGDSTPSLPLPNNEYKNLILSGAKYWRLPEAYVRELNAIEVDG
jgi:gamma-glutamylcyclotransferase